MKKPLILLWLRQDLRLFDHPALCAAAREGRVLPVYIWDKENKDKWRPGASSQWWLHHALADLQKAYRAKGGKLALRSGNPLKVLQSLIDETNASAVYFSRRYEPFAREQDEAITKKLTEAGVAVKTFNASLLFEPWEIKTKSGAPFKVYTPFSRACFAAASNDAPLSMPKDIRFYTDVKSEKLKDWNLLSTHPNWAKNFEKIWDASEQGATDRLQDFIDQKIGSYKSDRDRPDRDGTSRLSPYLHFGQISPRFIWFSVSEAMRHRKGISTGAECFLKEVLWREFSYHLLYAAPSLPDQPLQKQFARFPWHKNPKALRAWQRGQTGYPIVDAGMRQLWQTGTMHNRVRMIVASFLIKDLLLPWQHGESWFWDTLVDADLACNAASWQWVAGCGADAAPFFRIFNPVLQSKKFDPDGNYIRAYVPELSALPSRFVHAPWEAAPALLKRAGITLGRTYPSPIVNHARAREEALAALQHIHIA